MEHDDTVVRAAPDRRCCDDCRAGNERGNTWVGAGSTLRPTADFEPGDDKGTLAVRPWRFSWRHQEPHRIAPHDSKQMPRGSVRCGSLEQGFVVARHDVGAVTRPRRHASLFHRRGGSAHEQSALFLARTVGRMLLVGPPAGCRRTTTWSEESQ